MSSFDPPCFTIWGKDLFFWLLKSSSLATAALSAFTVSWSRYHTWQSLAVDKFGSWQMLMPSTIAHGGSAAMSSSSVLWWNVKSQNMVEHIFCVPVPLAPWPQNHVKTFYRSSTPIRSCSPRVRCEHSQPKVVRRPFHTTHQQVTTAGSEPGEAYERKNWWKWEVVVESDKTW